MLWVGGDLMQRLRRRPEQDVIDHSLVLERDRGDLVRHREHYVEIGHVEQLCLTVFEPLGAGETLALRTVPITARVVRDTLMAAVAATLDVTAECRGATALDSDHGTAARARQRRAVLIAESRAEVAEDVRHLQPLAWHGSAVRRAAGPAPWLSRCTRLPADWPWRRPCWWRCADNETWCSGCDAPAAIEWYVDRCRTPAGERRTRAAKNAG